jgi:hypothetical protein
MEDNMNEQGELEHGDTNHQKEESDLCPCGCGRTTAPFDTNPQSAGSRPFVSRDGLKIWLADWHCIENATRALMRESSAWVHGACSPIEQTYSQHIRVQTKQHHPYHGWCLHYDEGGPDWAFDNKSQSGSSTCNFRSVCYNLFTFAGLLSKCFLVLLHKAKDIYTGL